MDGNQDIISQAGDKQSQEAKGYLHNAEGASRGHPVTERLSKPFVLWEAKKDVVNSLKGEKGRTGEGEEEKGGREGLLAERELSFQIKHQNSFAKPENKRHPSYPSTQTFSPSPRYVQRPIRLSKP